MTRKKKPLPILENITITDVAAEGKAIAKVDNLVVFVPYAVPGDVVDLQVRRKNTAMPKLRSSSSISTRTSAVSLSASTLVYVAAANGNACHIQSNCITSKSK